jgi:hypothetical protein
MGTNKQELRNEAIRQIGSELKSNLDWQEIMVSVCNDDHYQPLFEGKDEDEAARYFMGLLKFAEHQVGHA